MFPTGFIQGFCHSSHVVFLGRGVLASLAVFAAVACNDARAARSDEGSTSQSAATSSAMAQPAGLRWAKTLDWSRRGSVVTLTVTEPWKGARTPLRYQLYLKDTAASATHSAPSSKASPEAAGVQSVNVPARRIVALASVHTGFLTALGVADRIVAVDAKRHVYSPTVRAAITAGLVIEVGAGAALNVERLLAAKPDLVLTNSVGASEYAALDRLRRAGIPVLVTAEWMEHHPLARAEWVRLIGVLVGAEARADSLFAVVESSYRRMADQGRGAAARPTVLLGGPFRDQWFVSGGRSFMAGLIGDAGGDYLWRDDTTAGGVPLGFESVLAHARDADIWLHPGDWRRLDDGLRQDARFREFGAFRRGDVYTHDARRHEDGANDYWETGVVRPDRVLADLLSLFHGTEDSLYYYKRLAP
jgi:iron complex transport system substrate-binding protein